MSVKLYRHNESGEVVAATPTLLVFSDDDGKESHSEMVFQVLRAEKDPQALKIPRTEQIASSIFCRKYTPLPEAPEVGSDEWAYQQVKRGRQVCIPLLSGRKRIAVDIYEFCELITEYSEYSHQDFKSWEILPPLKPIVELLPHEFKHRQKVLVADCVGDFWLLGEFDTYAHGDFEPFRVCEGRAEEGVFGFKHCIPFEGNESLKGSQMQSEHGAVPRGYVPPHVPKLGELEEIEKDFKEVLKKLISLKGKIK